MDFNICHIFVKRTCMLIIIIIIILIVEIVNIRHTYTHNHIQVVYGIGEGGRGGGIDWYQLQWLYHYRQECKECFTSV